jgi:hypothetical protein
MVALAVMCTGWGRCMVGTSAKLEGTMDDAKDGDDGRGGRKGRYDVRTTSKSNVLDRRDVRTTSKSNVLDRRDG